MAPRRRVWPWLIALVVVAGLAVVAWLLAESIARSIVQNTIRDQVISQLALPDDQVVEVELAGQVLPQLIVGRLDDIALASDDVVFGPLSGDIAVRATGVPLRDDGAIEAASGTVTLDDAQLRTLLETIDGFPADTVSLGADTIDVDIALTVFGLSVPVGVTLSPGAADGDLVLVPAAIQVAGADLSAEALRDQFGLVSETVLRDWPVCIREYLPAGVELTDVTVDAGAVVASFGIGGRILSDPALQADGTCAESAG